LYNKIFHLSKLKGGEASGRSAVPGSNRRQGPSGWSPNGKVAHPNWSADLMSKKLLKKESQREVGSGF